MKNKYGFRYWPTLVVVLALVLPPSGRLYADGNQVMGEVQFEAKTNVDKTSGVWVDGQYVGYVKELKGSKKVLLLPGQHEITVRQNGYQDFTETVSVQPGQTQIVNVTMQKAVTGAMPPDADLATVRLHVNPSRAAVFVDDRFVGHVAEFEGIGKSMLVVPGAHKIRIALPGYETFQTDISALPRQKVEVKTDLVKSNVPVDGQLLKGATSPAVAGNSDKDKHGAGNPPQ
jgi:PEGA domain